MNNGTNDVLRCESLPAIAYVYDLSTGSTIYQDHHLARALGNRREEAERIGNDALAHPLHPEEFRQIPTLLRRWDHAEDGDIIETKHRLRCKNGGWRWFLGRDIELNSDDNGKVTQLLGTSFAITQRKLLEEKLRHAQKLEGVGQLAGGIAHDFNNLLTSIFGNVRLALFSAKDLGIVHSDLGESLKEIELASCSASVLTQQLLSFASKQMLGKETINTILAIVDSSRLVRSIIVESISLDLTLSADPHIYFAPEQFTQLLPNLAINARDAMPEGGKLRIQTFPEPPIVQDESINTKTELNSNARIPSASNKIDNAKIIVSDTGTGIDEAIQEWIFEPYFTAKSSRKGTGLGLAAVYGIVTRSSGTIEVNTSDEGTAFLMRFPEMVPPALTKATLIEQTKYSWEGLRALVIEDSVPVASVLTAMLEKQRLSVIVVNDGPETLKYAELADTPPYHLIVTNVVLPHMSGLEVINQIRQRWPQLPVLFLSGYALQGHNPELHRQNTAFLSKPVDVALLRAELAMLL